MNTQHVNKRIPRGDRNVLEWKYKGQLPYSGNTYFTVKKTTDPTDDRLIDVLCSTDYDAETEKTTITAIVPANNTADLQSSTYKYDVANYGENDGEEFTPFSGDLFLIGDVRTPFDGTDLPDPELRYIPIMARNFDDGDIIQKSGDEYVGIPPGQLADENFYNKPEVDQFVSDLESADSQMSGDISNLQANVNYLLELQDFLLNGNIDEMDTNVSIDFNKSLIRIGAL